MEKPEEKKNNQVVEKIPEKLLNPITEAQKVKSKLTQEFFQISIQLASLQKKSQDVLGKMQSNGESMGNKIKRAFDKMKLGKKKDVRWQYDAGKGAFVGNSRPTPNPKPKTDVK